jgi:uncharacterized membrane protein
MLHNSIMTLGLLFLVSLMLGMLEIAPIPPRRQILKSPLISRLSKHPKLSGGLVGQAIDTMLGIVGVTAKSTLKVKALNHLDIESAREKPSKGQSRVREVSRLR